MTDPFLTSYGVMVAALRDEPADIRALLDGLNPVELAHVAEGTALALAEAVRLALPAETVLDMITNLQALAAADTAEGTPR
ncbi:hypothetical protein OG432_30375 [Streptomyces sp. NBC_00442]|uniref:hypothetical protein n=1 Tax=Streptomyces sp. NBC_00442 TaxID=2903651 RepID=UPI002E201A45